MRHDADSTAAASAGLGLSLKLALVYAILFTTAALAFFFLAYYLVAAALEQQELAAVRDRVREYRAWYLEGGLRALGDRFEEQRHNTADILFIRVTGWREDVIFYSDPNAPITPEALRALPAGDHLPRLNLPGSDNKKHRWTVVSAELPGGSVLQAGKSAQYLERTLSRFRRIFTLTLIPTLVAGIALSTAIAFHGLRPIRKLIETMNGILATGDLERRAPGAGSRDELQALGSLFNRLLDRNRKLVETTRESLDAVAHDLRTPMTRLRNVAERALAEPDNRGPGPQREALATCLEESDNALTLLRSLTEIAEAETGALVLARQPVAVADLVAQVAGLYEFVAEERGIRLDTGSIPAGLTLDADRARLQQILANLVDNAIKYSPDGATVTVAAREDAASGEIAISVSDEGPGIPGADLPRIFDRLYRGDASRSEKPGLGLGLSLVRAIAEAHGGRVTAENGSGEKGGAVFTVVLPGRPAPIPG